MFSRLYGVLGGVFATAYLNSSNVSNFFGFLGQHPQMKDDGCMLGGGLFFR